MKKHKHPVITDADIGLVRRVLKSSRLSSFRGSPEGHLGGKNVQSLEAAFSDYFGVKHAISMNSATACLHAACVACDIGIGDEVIVSPYSFVSSASCVLMVGAKPVFVDIQDDIFCIDPLKVEEAITPYTKAIIPVHLCGHPADMTRIMDIANYYGLYVIEDAAQAIGAAWDGEYVGTLGDCGIFSFNQSKQISSGEGGMLITNDNKIARIARAVRNHGEVSDPELKIVGYNYRMCEIEAILAREQFLRLGGNLLHRRALADYMTQELNKIGGLDTPWICPGATHSFYTYAVKYKREEMTRDEFQDKLMERGVYFGKGYVKPLYLLPIFGGREGQCPVTERMWEELMVFDWLRPPATFGDIDEAISVVKGVLNGN